MPLMKGTALCHFWLYKSCAAVKVYSNRDPNESSHNDILYAKEKVKNMEKFDDEIKFISREGKESTNYLENLASPNEKDINSAFLL